ncbi:MAG: phosphoethanolamine transferase [Methylobacterium mesophilicum]|nr:phosphoethanolamine transferase [Methylobacterium mesophilicum]
MRLFRPRLSSITLAVLTAAYILLVLNRAFWGRAITYFSGSPVEGISFGIAFALLIVALCVSFSAKYVIKPALIVFVMISAAAAYFVDDFGIVITRDMVRDLFNTTAGEAGSFMSVALVLHFVLYGLVPSLLILWVEVRHETFLRKLARNSAVVFPLIFAACGLIFANYAGIASTFREHGDLLASSNPGGPIAAAVRFGTISWRNANFTLKPIGLDARQVTSPGRAPRLAVIVVGETVRAQDFGLNDGARDTTPELRAANVINYPNATSCGTATAVSVPCMFSMYGRADYSDYKGLSTENLADVLKRAGVRVVWWDNNTGSKGVADRVEYRRMDTRNPTECQAGECFDQMLLDGLDPFLDGVRQDTVLVLHMLGSHGPSYYKRYPAAFRRFTPECLSAHLTDCSRAEIVNAYDNSVLYSDYVLGQVIGKLKARGGRIEPAMMFVSDHGESLGEDGLYLHGAPYFMAPAEQTRIPMALWLGDSLAGSARIDAGCMRARSGEAVSQDNLFPSILGLMDVETSLRNPALDLFAPCRKTPPALAQM